MSDYSLRPRHTQPSGPNAQCPTTQPWFAFRTAVSLHVPSHLGSSCSVYPLSLRDAGPGATRSCTFDDHTPPSCLIAYRLAKMVYRSVNTLVLPDPWLTQGGPVTFPACALYQLFVRSCDLAHHGLHCSHVCVCTHHSSLQHLLFCVRFLLSLSCPYGRTSEHAAATWHHRVESLVPHGQSALSPSLPSLPSLPSPPLPFTLPLPASCRLWFLLPPVNRPLP